MLDTNNFDYETTTLYDALEAYTTSLESQDDNVTNSTNATWPSYDVCDPSSYPQDFLTSSLFHGCIYLMYSIVFLVALLGNGLVCFVVQTSPRMKTVTNYFIVNLAVGDILMTLFCVPFSFVPMLILRYWPFGFVMCKVVNYTQAVSVLVSAYTLLAISIDRYMAIMRPLRPRLGKAAAKMVVAAVWLGALTTAAPIAVVTQLQRPTPWHKLCQADICFEQWEHAGQSGQYTCALLILQFALPLAALVCTYARIAHAVWGGRPPGEAQDARDSRLQHSKRKMIKMMVIVVTVFTMCWLPLNMFIVLWTVHEEDERWATWPGMPYMWFACHWLAMSHCCYNPIIYCYMNNRYRRGFKQAFGCIFRKRLETSSRHRTSMCEGVQMSEIVGVNGMTRRGTTSSCLSRLHRVPTCSSCTSVRRGLTTIPRPCAPSAPVRALSVRTHLN
ncbi:RYamide receptor-like [Spodoptera litura]|uniref:RYamide receptor-like n=1 Tax=Spodoptera litura TaxID=69820 RepID=A0A9J7ECB9_SPOLT|nr:RYamide receptor-like [Spodoptera litura]